MKKIIFAIISFLVISCSQKQNADFSLTGKTNGLENGTIVYLENADSQNTDIIDSTRVENNTFSFKTKLPNAPFHAFLRTNNGSYYRFIWLENTTMTFDASQTDFENASVTGSEAENLAQPLRIELDKLSEEAQRKRELEFIEKHPNSIVSAEILSLYSTSFDKTKTKELFDKFSKQNKQSKYGKILEDYIDLNKSPKIGEQYADFEMTDLNGNLKRLSDLNGKVILLDFWASWCAPCRKENPNLVKIHKKFNQKGFEIFAVSLDENKDKWKTVIEKDNLNWHQVNDFKGQGSKAALIYGVEGIPDNFLIDKDGKIIGRDLRGDELEEKLIEILK